MKRLGTLSLYVCLLLIAISILIMAAVPPVSRDALTHHLAIPKLWIKHGGIYEIPSLIVSYYPMNMELLYWIPLYLGNDIVPKYIHFIFALATSWLIYLYLKERTTQKLSLLGVLFFLSTPVIVKLSITAYVDLGLVFFSWATIYYLFSWGECPDRLKYFVLSAICCGFMLGTKYNGIIVLILLTLLIPLFYVRVKSDRELKIKTVIAYPVIFLLISIAVYSPWMIRNFSLTNNPVYPLYNEFFKVKTDRKIISNMSMKPWLQRKLIYHESAFETALIPIRIFFQSKDDDPKFFDGKLNPLLFLLPFLVLLKNKKRSAKIKTEMLFLSSFSVLYLLYASFMVDMRIRYITPIIPPLVVLAVFGVGNIVQWLDDVKGRRPKAFGRVVFITLLSVFVFMNAQYIVGLFRSVNPVPYILGEISREAYIADKLPSYSAVQFVNQIKFDNMRIMGLFLGKRLYYFEKKVDFAMLKFQNMVEQSASAEDLEANLLKEGYSHCVMGLEHFNYWARQVFSEEKKMLISKWLDNYCQLLYRKNGYAVLQLQQ